MALPRAHLQDPICFGNHGVWHLLCLTLKTRGFQNRQRNSSFQLTTRECCYWVPCVSLADCLLCFVIFHSLWKILNLVTKCKDMCLPFKLPQGESKDKWRRHRLNLYVLIFRTFCISGLSHMQINLSYFFSLFKNFIHFISVIYAWESQYCNLHGSTHCRNLELKPSKQKSKDIYIYVYSACVCVRACVFVCVYACNKVRSCIYLDYSL